MLSEADVKKIQDQFKIPGLVEAFKAPEEKAVVLPEDVIVLDDAGLQQVKNTEYANGKEKGLEMAVKDYGKTNGIEFTGKTIDGLVKAAQAKAIKDANVEPDEQVKQLTTELDNVRKNYTDLEQKLQQKESLATKAAITTGIISEVPTLGDKSAPVAKVLKLMEVDGYEFKQENGKTVTYLNGEKVVDKLSQPVPVKDIIPTYAKENNLMIEVTGNPGNPKGRGADDGKEPVVFTKLSELKQHFVDNKKNVQGKEFMDTLKQIRKDNPEFNMAE